MNRHLLSKLALAACSAFVVAGCATQATTGETASPPVGELITDKPQIWLPGASRAEVKSIAMGAAHSKGWTLVNDAGERIIFERPMDPTAPQAVALGSGGDTEPVVEVTSYFVAHDDGVRVALDAAVRTKDADGAVQRVDWTEAYRGDLVQSLESLRATWSADRERVSAALAARRSAAQSPALERDEPPDLSQPPDDPLRAAWAAETTLVDQQPESTAAPTDTADEADSSATDLPAASSSNTAASTRAASPAPTPQASSEDPERGAASAEGSALALRQGRQPAMWTYYAEYYALRTGCTLTDSGSRLVAQQPTYEIHEVACANRSSLRLRCQHGFCRPVD